MLNYLAALFAYKKSGWNNKKASKVILNLLIKRQAFAQYNNRRNNLDNFDKLLSINDCNKKSNLDPLPQTPSYEQVINDANNFPKNVN